MSAAAAPEAGTAAAFPWDAALGFALGQLRMAPADFWRMTPRELAAALRPFAERAHPGPPGRAALEALMHDFPDRR